jgi:large subunit ribosomal protein L35
VATKNKTNKSVTKRLKRTATGKLKHQTPGKRHLNAHMTPKRKRQLRKAGVITGALVKKYLIAMNEY